MNDRDQRRYDRATNVQTFGRVNTADFAAGGKAQTLFARLDLLLVRLDAAKAGQNPDRVSKQTLVDSLRLDLRNLSRTASVIAQQENGFAAPYRLPESPGEEATATHADAVLLRLEDQLTDPPAMKTAKAALFRPLWKVATTEMRYPEEAYRHRDPSLNVSLNNNKISGTGFDFSALTSLADAGTYTNFTTTSAPGQTTNRLALAPGSATTGFYPTGVVERIVLQTTNLTQTYQWLATNSTVTNPVYHSLTTNDAVLLGALEVALGTPQTTNGILYVPVRLALQPTPLAGQAGTVPQTNQTVWLRTVYNGTGVIETSLTTDATGLAWFPHPLTTNANNLLQFTAWADAGAGTANVFDEWQDAWATAQWHQNAVVWVKAGPDVANDKSLARGRFHFFRSGSAAQLSNTLAISFTLPTNTNVAGIRLPATYGNTGAADYYLAANSATNPPAAWTTVTNAGVITGGTLTFQTNQTEAVLELVPRVDNNFESNVTYLALAGGTNYVIPAATNALTPGQASIYIYDGPQFSLYLLGDTMNLPGGYRPAAATTAYALNNQNPAMIAGETAYCCDGIPIPDQHFAGYWTSSTSGQLTDLTYYNGHSGYDPYLGYVTYADWHGQTFGVSDYGILAGRKGTAAFTWQNGTSNILAHLSTANHSGAMGINADAGNPDPNYHYTRYVVGFSDLTNGAARPVVWQDGNAVVDLAATFLPPTGRGTNFGANSAGVIVGQGEILIGTTAVLRAFRSRDLGDGNVQSLVAGDELPPLGIQTNTSTLAVAWNVNENGVAVGSSISVLSGTNYFPKAVFWAARSSTNANPAASALKRFADNIIRYDANAINSAATPWIVGWSNDGTANHATLWTNASTNAYAYNLDDAHFIQPLTGWRLESAMSVNNAGWIIGNGTLNGVKRAFLLVPQVPGN